MLYIKYRQDIPWGWKKSLLAYRDVVSAGWALAKSCVRKAFHGDQEEVSFWYFEFLKKLAERVGFIRQSLSQGYLYL